MSVQHLLALHLLASIRAGFRCGRATISRYDPIAHDRIKWTSMPNWPHALVGLAPSLGRLGVPHTGGSSRTVRSIPTGPTCSRWSFCSCYPSQKSESSNYASTSRDIYDTPLVPGHAEYDKPEEKERSTRRKAFHHLPLPSTLPYSPDSHPFKRQIEILSLYVTGGSADESWETYLAIHPDLHRYIPDNLFRSLVTHQLSNSRSSVRWSRSTMLLRLAKRCGVEAKDLGHEVVERLLSEGLRHASTAPQSSIEKSYPRLRYLWRSLSEFANGELFKIPTDIRQLWLQLHLRRCHTSEWQSARTAHKDAADAALREIVDGGGGEGMEDVAGAIMSFGRPVVQDIQRVALQKITTLSVDGVKVPKLPTRTDMRRLRRVWEGTARESTARLRDDLSSIIADLQPVDEGLMAHLRFYLEVGRRNSRRRIKCTLGVLHLEDARVPELLREGLKLLGKPAKTVDLLDQVITILERALRYRDAECQALIARLLVSLLPRSDLNVKDTVSLVTRLTNVILASHALPYLDGKVIHLLFHLILSAQHSDETYILARKVYPMARATDPPFRWSPHLIDTWRSLFYETIGPRRRHIHLASRLYADLLADGIAIRRVDSIAMIRAIGTSRGASRRVLLDRHLKDYMWAARVWRPDFLLSVVQGLTASGKRSDHLLAFQLVLQLSVGQSVSAEVASRLLARLPSTEQATNHRYFLDLLHSVPPVPESATSYETAISTVISSISAATISNRTSPSQGLHGALVLYKDMISRNIPPTDWTISLLIRGLSQADQLDSAVKVFHASMNAGKLISSDAAGKLMISLGSSGRFTEADEVGNRWRGATAPDSTQADHGVSLASLLLDLQRGINVDVAEVARRGGWRGTKELFWSMERFKPWSATPNLFDKLLPEWSVSQRSESRLSPEMADVLDLKAT